MAKTTTTEEYDKHGNLMKRVVVTEEDTLYPNHVLPPYIPPTRRPSGNFPWRDVQIWC